MSRNICAVFFAIALLVAPVIAVAQMPVPSAPELGARGYILVDHKSGQTLAEKDSDDRMDPASITKLMTAYAVFRALKSGEISLQDQVLISEKAWRTAGSRMFI